MTVIDTLLQRNEAFARDGFQPGLKIIPSQKIMLIGCVDPRVDPAEIFQLEPGEAAVIRNVGGRVTPSALADLEMLRVVAEKSGGKFGPGWNLVVLHHTGCGINCLAHSPELLSGYFGVPAEKLEALAITDPHKSVAVDVATLKANPALPAEFTVSGLVYDVATGRVATVVPPAPLRS